MNVNELHRLDVIFLTILFPLFPEKRIFENPLVSTKDIYLQCMCNVYD